MFYCCSPKIDSNYLNLEKDEPGEEAQVSELIYDSQDGEAVSRSDNTVSEDDDTVSQDDNTVDVNTGNSSAEAGSSSKTHNSEHKENVPETVRPDYLPLVRTSSDTSASSLVRTNSDTSASSYPIAIPNNPGDQRLDPLDFDPTAEPNEDLSKLSRTEQKKFNQIMDQVRSLKNCVSKEWKRSPDAFSSIGKWFVETDYVGWSSVQWLRGLMTNQPNSSSGQTVGLESVDAFNSASVATFFLSLPDTISSYVGFKNAGVDLKNAKDGVLIHMFAKIEAEFLSRMIDDVSKETTLSPPLREQLLQELKACYQAADKQAFEALKKSGSVLEKERIWRGKAVGGFGRDTLVQPVQQTLNVSSFILKAISSTGDAIKDFLKSALAIIGKIISALGTITGLLQLIQGAIETDAAVKKGQLISRNKHKHLKMDKKLKEAKSGAITDLCKNISAHCETERKKVRTTTKWDRAIGIVRTIYGCALMAFGILTLALPFLAPITVMAGFFLTAAYIGWTAIRISVLRHRKKRLDKEKTRMKHECALVIKAAASTFKDGIIPEAFWQDPHLLQNRMFALEAAKHYLTKEGTDAGITDEGRKALHSFLTEMGVPAEAFVNPDTLTDKLSFHLLEDGAYIPREPEPVEMAINLLGKNDVFSKARGADILHGLIKQAGKNGEIEDKIAAAITDAVRASTPSEQKIAAQKIRDLFKGISTTESEPDGGRIQTVSNEGQQPATVDATTGFGQQAERAVSIDDAGMIGKIIDALNAQTTIKIENAADRDAAKILLQKMRGYSNAEVMKSLKCYSGSMFSVSVRSARFDRVSPKVAMEVLGEQLRNSSNKELHENPAQLGTEEQSRAKRLVELCAYAAQQEGMVQYGVFNHKVHPDFERLTAAIDEVIQNKKGSEWLLHAIDNWKGGETEKQAFWSSLKIALLPREKKNFSEKLVRALEKDQKSAETALKWLSPKDTKGTIDGLMDAWTKAMNNVKGDKDEKQRLRKELAQYIEYTLNIRKYVAGEFKWLGEAIRPQTVLEILQQDLSQCASSKDHANVLCEFLEQAPGTSNDVINVLNELGLEESTEPEYRALVEKLKKNKYIDLYREVLVAGRQDAEMTNPIKRFVHWFKEKLTESHEKRITTNRDFVANHLAYVLKEQPMNGSEKQNGRKIQPISRDFLVKLKQMGKKDLAAANEFLRTHYAIRLGKQIKAKEKEPKMEFSSLLQMARKHMTWVSAPPSTKELCACVQSKARSDRRAAKLYLSRLRMPTDQIKRLVGNPQEFMNEFCTFLSVRRGLEEKQIKSGMAQEQDASEPNHERSASNTKQDRSTNDTNQDRNASDMNQNLALAA